MLKTGAKNVTKGFNLFMLLTIMSGCFGLFERDYIDTREVTYVGKYYSTYVTNTGKGTNTSHDYHFIFKLLDKDGVATPIKVYVTEGEYVGTPRIDGNPELPFYKNSRGDIFTVIGDKEYRVKDYDAKTPIRGTLEHYDFIDQLYKPMDYGVI